MAAEDREYRRMTRCGVENCKETRYYLEDGRWFCRRGHQREGELDVGEDDENPLAQKGRRAQREVVSKTTVSRVLTGRKGFELYLQCYQLVLQKQVWWLIHDRGYPEELELVVRDLWSLRLQVVSSLAPPSRSQSAASPDRQSASQSEHPSQSDSEGAADSSSSFAYSSGNESVTTTATVRRRRQRRVPKASDRPKLPESLALCYLGLVLLRSAVCLGDIHRWADEQRLLYMRAITEIPATMKSMLAAEYYTALDPVVKPARGALSRKVQSLVILFHDRFGLVFPEVSHRLLTLRFVFELGAPLEVVPAVKSLIEYLALKLEWPTVVQGEEYEKKMTWFWPEARIMALITVAVKLCYGLDGIERAPKTAMEPAAMTFGWDAWEEFMAERCGGLLGKESKALPMDVKEMDVFGMSGEELDRYMDWYEKSWCGEGQTNGLPESLLNLFPLSNPTPAPPDPSVQTPLETRLKDLNSQISQISPASVNTPLSSPAPIHPGEQYLFYCVDDEIPQKQRIFVKAAADLIAVSRLDLTKVIRKIETNLRRDLQDKRRAIRREKRAGGRVEGEEVEGEGVEGEGREGGREKATAAEETDE